MRTTPCCAAISSTPGCCGASAAYTGGSDGAPGRHPQTQDGPELRGPADPPGAPGPHPRERAKGAVGRVQPGLGVPRARGEDRDRALLGRAVARAEALGVRLAGLFQRASAGRLPKPQASVPSTLLAARQRLDRFGRTPMASALLGHRHRDGGDADAVDGHGSWSWRVLLWSAGPRTVQTNVCGTG